MNSETLKELVDKLRNDEQEVQAQQHLNNLNEAMKAFASQPQQQELQIKVSNALITLMERFQELENRYDPAKQKRLESIGAQEFFSRRIAETIQKAVIENPMTPAVAQQALQELLTRRQTYLSNLEAASTSLKALGIEPGHLEEGTAEIGFQIPRELFKGELEGLIKELGAIKRIIRAFSELKTGTVEAIEVRQISTSEPVFFFGLSVSTIVAIGAAITWALNTWKQIEEIRKLRLETSKSQSFTKEDIEAFFGNKIRKTIEDAIEAKSKELVEDADGKAGRKKEQRTDIAWALKSIFARVERGMTVEIRFLPPPKPVVAEPGDDESQVQAAFKTLGEIAPQLLFPTPDPSPVLALPPTEPDTKTDKQSKTTDAT